MPYDGSPSHMSYLINALKVIKRKGIPASDLAADIARFYKRATVISVSTINRYTNYDPAQPGPISFDIAFPLFSFFERNVKYHTRYINPVKFDYEDSEKSLLVHYILDNFRPDAESIKYEMLESLVGDYAMFRRAWTSPKARLYVRSFTKISMLNGCYHYIDNQKYYDHISLTDVNETDVGLLFPFGMSVIILSKVKDLDCMKFIVMHEFAPWPNGRDSISWFAGSLIAVSGRGPYQSYKFFCTKIRDSDYESRLLSESDLTEAILDKIS